MVHWFDSVCRMSTCSLACQDERRSLTKEKAVKARRNPPADRQLAEGEQLALRQGCKEAEENMYELAAVQEFGLWKEDPSPSSLGMGILA